MGASGGFPIDLILLGMVAAFLVLRLRSVLGRRSGYERPAQPYKPPTAVPGPGPVIEGKTEPAASVQSRELPEPSSALGQKLAEIGRIDATFSVAAFLDGAERAFQLIVTAFAAGDRSSLANLLTPKTRAAFEEGISERENAGNTQVNEIRSLQKAAIQAADLQNAIASITVQFVSDQVNYTRDRADQIVTGTDAVTEITDLWTFERDLASHDPTWRLAVAASA